MKQSEYREFQTILEQKAAELTKTLRDRNTIAVERAPDAVDEWALSAEREMNALTLHSVTNLLHQVRAALQRMKDGTYGVCMRCEEEISLKRLGVVPWAERCVRCQEKEDRSELGRRFDAAA